MRLKNTAKETTFGLKHHLGGMGVPMELGMQIVENININLEKHHSFIDRK